MYGTENTGGLSFLENVAYVFDNLIILLSFVWMLILLMVILTSIGKWLTFKKINKKGYEALVPYHNTYEIIKVANMPGWNIFMLLIPIYGIVVHFKIHISFALAVGKTKRFGIFLSLFPFVCFLILGLDKRESFFRNPNERFIGTVNPQDGMNSAYLVDSFSNVETFNAPQGQAPIQNMQQQQTQAQQIQFVQPNYTQQGNSVMPNNQMQAQMMNPQMQNQMPNGYSQNNTQQNNQGNMFNTPNNQP